MLPTSLQSVFAALRHRNFRLFILGQFISLCGTWMQIIAQGWLVLQLTDSAFAVGLVTALGSLPILLFTLYGGVIADRCQQAPLHSLAPEPDLAEALTLASSPPPTSSPPLGHGARSVLGAPQRVRGADPASRSSRR